MWYNYGTLIFNNKNMINTWVENTGNRNTGDSNTGDWNTGDWNTGNWNTGDWNTGNRNTGIFNTDEPTMRAFNLDSGIKYSDWYNSDDYIYFWIEIVKYVWYSDMTAQEKKDHDYAKTTWWYLKTFTYLEAWHNWWNDNKSDQMIKKIKRLPNFNAKIFKEITWIVINDKK